MPLGWRGGYFPATRRSQVAAAASLHRGVVAGRTAPALCAEVDPVGARCPDRTDAYRVTQQLYRTKAMFSLRAAGRPRFGLCLRWLLTWDDRERNG